MTMLNINKLSLYVLLLSVSFAQILAVNAAENDLVSDDLDNSNCELSVEFDVSRCKEKVDISHLRLKGNWVNISAYVRIRNNDNTKSKRDIKLTFKTVCFKS
ncbi:hypothetical protein DEU56DRAFT_758616 [Suillus clintonianus]|uniref:uncharacterized protein n=1 Tax=Suillus clintonianus TaxID=1904413 RepID=UPI001B87EDB5|nr:uncharacterized protein DEU56DRAFT_758616 [Suillus clintonianus]KAG2127495.1 hypothetical protein DEU56DRAFT_758616 [Suillus clintonianus]